MQQFYHHSRLHTYRHPQGALPCGTEVTLSADVAGDCLAARIELRLWSDDAGETLLPMQLQNGRAEVRFRLPETPGLLWYYFVLHMPNGSTQFYGGRSGKGQRTHSDPASFRITVYDGAYQTPDWFSEGMCYQIFPDRFFRSSWEDFHARIDAHTAIGQHPRVHERWSEAPLDTPPPGKTIYEPDDFFGGDLNGIRKKLDYLASFGVTCLYLNPIFASSSNHRYNTSDYHRIDPLLGSEEDLRLLCEEARARGIRIMLDGVFSHTGSDSLYFNREGHYGKDTGAYRDPDSPYAEWYDFEKWPETYDCWWGFETLPNVRELTPSYVDFIAGENGVLAHWARCGATNWRLDVADELPDEFIRILRKRVKSLDPEGVLLGEVWEEPTAKRGPEGRRGYVNGDELDSVMNYCFTNAVIDYLTGQTTAFAFADELLFLQEQYPAPFFRAALNLMGSHDVERVMTRLTGAPSRHTMTREQQKRYQPSAASLQLAERRMPLAAALQTVFPGVPCLYYGDEVGLTGMGDPYNRTTYPWGQENKALLEQMRSVYLWRRKNEALRRGTCRMGALNESVFCIVRETENAQAILFVNRSEHEQPALLTSGDLSEGPDAQGPLQLLGDYRASCGPDYRADGAFSVTLAPLSAILFEKIETR